jgi:hypothetical protein
LNHFDGNWNGKSVKTAKKSFSAPRFFKRGALQDQKIDAGAKFSLSGQKISFILLLAKHTLL